MKRQLKLRKSGGSNAQRFVPGQARQVGDESNRVLRILGTDETVDRYNTIIPTSSWKTDNYRKNPLFLWAHDSDAPPVGKTLAITEVVSKRAVKNRKTGKEETREVKGLAFDVQFADRDTYPFADVIYKLYKGGFLRGSSVGFRNLKSRTVDDEDEAKELGFEGDSGRILTSNELMELSAVPIPANPNALVEEMKGLAPASTRSWFNDVTGDVDEVWMAQALKRIQKALEQTVVNRQDEEEEETEEEEEETEEEEDEEKQADGETSPDFFDEHVHEITSLDEEGNGETGEAGEPAHTHDIMNGLVIPMGGGEGDVKYLSWHPGIVEVAATEEEEDEDETGEEPGPEPPEGTPAPETGTSATDTRAKKKKKKKKKPSPYRAVTRTELRRIIGKAEHRFMDCMKGVAKRTEVTGLELKMDQLASEIRGIKAGKGRGVKPAPSADETYASLEGHEDTLRNIEKLATERE